MLLQIQASIQLGTVQTDLWSSNSLKTSTLILLNCYYKTVLVLIQACYRQVSGLVLGPVLGPVLGLVLGPVLGLVLD